MTTISALAVLGQPAPCPTCRAPGEAYVERESVLPVAHRDDCAALAAERRRWRDDLVAVDLNGGRSVHRHVDTDEAELAAVLGFDVEALARVEVLDGRRVRSFALADTTTEVTW